MMNNGKICISVCAETADQLIEQIKQAADSADVIEIRFDCLKKIETDKLWSRIKQFRKQFDGKLLATFRPRNKGQGGNRELSSKERFEFWRDSAVDEFIDWADVEFDFDFQHSKGYLRAVYKRFIWSFHAFGVVPNDYNLNLILKKLSDLTADKQSGNDSDVLKIAIRTDDITDTISIWKLLERAKAENRQIIPIAMGESGKWTRILGLAHGAFMTYAALGAGQETAPGQVSARDLIEVYRAKELDENTEVYGILGSNTSVSMSPYIHNTAFKHHGLNAVFVPLQVHDLDEFMRRMVKPSTREIELNFKGFSVTIPHKQAIIKHLDFVDETAAKIGAVNTVKIIDGKLYGYNTDAPGFIEPLLNSYGNLSGARVAVLGAGGAARACIYALQTAGAEVTIFARDLTKAKGLAEDFGVNFDEFPIANRKSQIASHDILVNTTPLGMKGKAEGETPVSAEQLKGLRLVYDLVYVPFQTPLMTEADLAEVPKIGGLAMLIAQAGEQQKIWTGLAAPMKEMSRAALKRLG
ncbi:MAG TPA: shikimate dehydrogenase [Pyrinomonadaceae bacterium]|jgi:3-dehydroquinate dehydratase/shikimate dehydrogenase